MTDETEDAFDRWLDAEFAVLQAMLGRSKRGSKGASKGRQNNSPSPTERAGAANNRSGDTQ